MLTAKTSPIERVIGLETGADDYVCKPFEPMELVSRVRSLLRRSKLNSNSEKLSQEASKIYFDSWTLDVLGRHLIRADGMVLSLSASEFNLLKLFIDHANQVMNRDQIMDHIYGRESGPFDRSIDIQVSRLRNKIENNPKSPMIIKTIRSEGYLFTPKVSGSL
jgi:two-component system OmpR family response regulator